MDADKDTDRDTEGQELTVREALLLYRRQVSENPHLGFAVVGEAPSHAAAAPEVPPCPAFPCTAIIIIIIITSFSQKHHHGKEQRARERRAREHTGEGGGVGGVETATEGLHSSSKGLDRKTPSRGGGGKESLVSLR